MRPARHRIQLAHLVDVSAHHRLERLHLIGRDIHQEVIRRVLGQLRLPFLQQRRAQQHHDQQQHDRQTEDQDLRDAFAATARETREREAPTAAGLHAEPPTGAQQQVRERAEHDRHAADAGHRPQRQSPAARVPQQQAERADRRERIRQRARYARDVEIAADHSHRRNRLQAHQRRQRKGGETDESADRAEQQRLDARHRQLQRHVRRQRRDDQQMQHAAGGQPATAATRADRAEQREIAAMNLRRRRAERLQDRNVIVVAARVTMRGERDGDAGEQHREQSAEQQERLGAIERGADRWRALANAHPSVSRRRVSPRARYAAARAHRRSPRSAADTRCGCRA